MIIIRVQRKGDRTDQVLAQRFVDLQKTEGPTKREHHVLFDQEDMMQGELMWDFYTAEEPYRPVKVKLSPILLQALEQQDKAAWRGFVEFIHTEIASR